MSPDSVSASRTIPTLREQALALAAEAKKRTLCGNWHLAKKTCRELGFLIGDQCTYCLLQEARDLLLVLPAPPQEKEP